MNRKLGMKKNTSRIVAGPKGLFFLHGKKNNGAEAEPRRAVLKKVFSKKIKKQKAQLLQRLKNIYIIGKLNAIF